MKAGRRMNGGRKLPSRGSAFVSPLYHLTAFGIQNEWVRWAISAGAYLDLQNRPVCEQDFGDAESRAIARRLGVRIDDRRQLR